MDRETKGGGGETRFRLPHGFCCCRNCGQKGRSGNQAERSTNPLEGVESRRGTGLGTQWCLEGQQQATLLGNLGTDTGLMLSWETSMDPGHSTTPCPPTQETLKEASLPLFQDRWGHSPQQKHP